MYLEDVHKHLRPSAAFLEHIRLFSSRMTSAIPWRYPRRVTEIDVGGAQAAHR